MKFDVGAFENSQILTITLPMIECNVCLFVSMRITKYTHMFGCIRLEKKKRPNRRGCLMIRNCD